jgi:hypothetical protein
MANLDGPEARQPAAWVWSEYRGDVSAPTTALQSSAADAGKNPGAIGLGVAAAVLAVAGLTWLFTTSCAFVPDVAPPPAAIDSPASGQKSETAPPPSAAEPVKAEPRTAVPPPPAAPQTHASGHGKKKKH